MILSPTKTAIGSKKIFVKDLFDSQELINKTGITNVFEAIESTVLLAYKACLELEPLIEKEKIKVCILVTQTPDYFLPANSIELAHKFGLSENCLSFDINQGCSGFVQALCLIEKLLSSYNNILLVTADRYRSKLNKSDRSTNAVFSDASTATLCKKDQELGIIFEDHLTDGSKKNLLFHSFEKTENDGYLHMSGAEVWMFTKTKVVKQIVKAINFCEENNLQINGIYIHQASKVVVEGIKSSLSSEMASKIYENYAKYGNTVSSSIAFLLQDYPLNVDGENHVNIFAGFGVGLTSSVIVYGRKSYGKNQ
ncbi:MAG: 3-oxoacyl-[acyl-carrier-protein] synthase III C-terminal domain-containing protein [Alphaproteobacteria bacterium]